MKTKAEQSEGRHDELLTNIKIGLPTLVALQDRCAGSSDAYAVYRFYHQSFKAFHAQTITIEIVEALRALAPGGCTLHPWFTNIVDAGTGLTFDMDVHNADWTRLVAPILVAYQHVRWFLDEVIRSGQQLETAPNLLPEGWAAVLYLYGLRHDV